MNIDIIDRFIEYQKRNEKRPDLCLIHSQTGTGKSLSMSIFIEAIRPHKHQAENIIQIKQELHDLISKTPETIRDLSPRKFEELIWSLLRSNGYEVQLTKQTHDGGKDIVVFMKGFMGEKYVIYIECKQYSPKRKIGINILEKFYGRLCRDNVPAGVLITTGFYTKDAIEFAKSVENRLKLFDFNQLISWILNSLVPNQFSMLEGGSLL